MRNYKELKIWQRSVELASKVYELTSNFPSEEKFALTSQIRRSVVSVSSNIAEGAGRFTDKEFSRFIDIAYGSLCELESQLIIANNLKFINESSFRSQIDEINELQKMIYSFSKTLKNTQAS